MSSVFLQPNKVIFYHPFDDFTEQTRGFVWSDYDDNSHFVSGVLTSGIQTDIGSQVSRLIYPDSTYDSLSSASGFTIALWVSGFLNSDTDQRSIIIGMADNIATPDIKNAISLAKSSTTDGFHIDSFINGNYRRIVWTPPPSNDPGWHFFVIDLRHETPYWRHRVSLDGGAWIDLGVNTDSSIPDVSTGPIIRIRDNTTIKTPVDEVILWGGNELFTSQELSNLYELSNTYNSTMDLYQEIFPLNVSNDLFVGGHKFFATSWHPETWERRP